MHSDFITLVNIYYCTTHRLFLRVLTNSIHFFLGESSMSESLNTMIHHSTIRRRENVGENDVSIRESQITMHGREQRDPQYINHRVKQKLAEMRQRSIGNERKQPIISQCCRMNKNSGHLVILIVCVFIIGFLFAHNGFPNQRVIAELPSPQLQRIPTKENRQDVDWCHDILSHYERGNESWVYGRHNFVSQDNQDWVLYASMFRHMPRRGVYLDLAANHPKWISNSFFLDKCMGWSGVCIEADPGLVKLIRANRSCQVVDTCVWEEPKEMTFMFNNGNGLAGLDGYNKVGVTKDARNITCTTVQTELDRFNVTHIDYLSLDIEGAEYQAMKGTDFNKTQIDVITVEVNSGKKSRDVEKFLESKGFLHMNFRFFLDKLYIHQNALDKLKWFKQWESEREKTKIVLDHVLDA